MLHPDRLQHSGLLTVSGSLTLSLCVGGLGVVIRSQEEKLVLAMDEPSRRFAGDAGREPLELDVSLADLSNVVRRSPIFEGGESWKLSREDSDWIFDFFTPLNGPSPCRRARIDGDFTRGEVVFHEPFARGAGEIDALQFPLAELLLIQRLARVGGLEIHACGIVDEVGRGIILAGRSGDGKTTSARLWAKRPDVTILSDDRIVLRPDAAGFRMYGTPWHGEGAFASSADAALSAVFLLEHGEMNEVKRLSPSEAVASMLPRCFLPFYDRTGVERVLATLDAAAHALSFYRLRFVPNQSAVALVRRTLDSLS